MRVIFNNTSLVFKTYDDMFVKNILNPLEVKKGIATANSVSDKWINTESNFYWYCGIDISAYPVGTTFYFIKKTENLRFSAKNVGFRGENSSWIEDNEYKEFVTSIIKTSDNQRYMYISVDNETYPMDNVANENGVFGSDTIWKPYL